jgi:RNA polymerase sigma factor (sigma-70 family)
MFLLGTYGAVASAQQQKYNDETWFYERHVGHVRRRLRRLGLSEDDTDEITQQTFAVAFTSGKVISSTWTRERAWLSEIAFRLGMNHLRLRRHALEETRWEWFDALEKPQEDQETTIATRELLHFALQDMTPEDRALLFERYAKESTLEELALKLGVTRSSVWSKLKTLRKHAEQRARECLENQRKPVG